MYDLRQLEIEIANSEVAKTNVYAHFPVVNEESIRNWVKTAFPRKAMTKDRLHVTVCYSSADVDLKQVTARKGFILAGSLSRKLELFGESVVIVLSPNENRRFIDAWQMFRDAGASWDYPTYIPHITIGSKWGISQAQLNKIDAYPGSISFGSMTTTALRID